jgi:prepilin-type N-terminal cleavage/methylation domain-containing protein
MITIANRKAVKMVSQKGYTLVELMFAVVIIAISVLAVYQMFIQGNQLIIEAYHRRQALENAQEKINMAAAYGPICDTVPRNLSGRFVETLEPDDQEGVEPIPVTYVLRVEHSDERNPDGTPSMSTVFIVYEWQERDGRVLQIELKVNVPS